jgi:large subunit ribosomal protein L23
MSNAINEVLLRPIITEKSSIQAKFGKYTFAIPDWANKDHVKEAFAKFFPKHKVRKVNIAKVFGKSRRTKKGRTTPIDSKKAIVSVEGDHIEYFPEI